MPDQPEPCGQTAPHSSHKFMRGRRVSRCPGAAPSGPAGVSPGSSGTCDASVTAVGGQPFGPCVLRHQHDGPVHKAADGTIWTMHLGDGYPAIGVDTVRALLDRYADKAAESTRNAKAIEDEETRTSLRGIAAGWRSAEFLLRHTLADLDNRRTTPDNPVVGAFPTVQGRCPACHGESLFLGSGGYITCARHDCPEPDAASTLLERVPDNIAAEAIAARRRALARNAVGAVLNTHGQWLPLSVREAVADAVLAAAEGADDAPEVEAHDRQPIPPEPARAAEDAAAHRILTTICETNGYRPPPPGVQITADDLAAIDRMVDYGTPFGEAVSDVIRLAAWQAQQADTVLDQRIDDARNQPEETPS